MTDMEKLTAFMKRVNPLLHEPLATTVAEEWGAKFVQEFPVFGKALTPTNDEPVAYAIYGRAPVRQDGVRHQHC